jgi:hypothetical protein
MAYTPVPNKAEDSTPANGDNLVPVAVVRQDSLGASAATDGKYGLLKTTAKDELYVKQTDAVPITDNSGSITVDQPTGTNLHTVVDSGAVTATLSAETTKVIGTVNQGTSPWVTSNATTSVVGNGAATTAQRVTLANDSTGILGSVGSISTSVTPGTAAANLGKAEDAGHTTGDVGVMSLGVRNDTLATTTNTTADYTQLTTDQAGILITAGAPRALKVQQQTTITSSTSETTILTAVVSTFQDVYGLVLTNSSATGTKITIKDATAGTTRLVFWCPANDTRGFMLPIDSAHSQAAVDGNWTATCGTSVASIDVTVMAVKRV